MDSYASHQLMHYLNAYHASVVAVALQQLITEFSEAELEAARETLRYMLLLDGIDE